MHRILDRQIKRVFGEQFVSTPEWEHFFEVVSDTYTHLDEDRAMTERSLELSSKEFLEITTHLREANAEADKAAKENAYNLERYQNLINNLSVGIYRNTPGQQGHFLEANPAIISLFEADTKEDFLHHNVSDFYQDPKKRALFAEKMMKQTFVKDEELELVTLKGKKIICSVSAVMKKDKDGNTYFDGIIVDISDRKRSEAALQHAYDELENRVQERTKELGEQVLELEDARRAMANLLDDFEHEQQVLARANAKDEAILGSMADGCIVVDASGKIVLINKMAQQMLGYSDNEANGRIWSEILHRENENGNPIPPEQGEIHSALLTPQNLRISGKYFYVRKDKTRFPVANTVATVQLENKIIGAIEVFHDITKEKEIDRTKTEFLSTASHALRTPLTAIDGIVSMMLDGEYGPIAEGLLQPLQDVSTSSERLIHLVNDLLNLSRIQAGRMKYTVSDFSIADVITQTVRLLQPLTQAKGLQLVVTTLDPVLVQADSDKVKEILNNLIGNAVKFTNTGTIEVSTKVVNDKVEINIRDTGIGISSEDQQKLFGLFQQVGSGQRQVIGTGLGLHISREMVSKMGGQIWVVRSQLGIGSTFAFSLPLARSLSAMVAREGIEAEAKEHPDQRSDTIVHTTYSNNSA